MALIKTVNELKEVLPRLLISLNQQSPLPNFDAAEEKYLVPLTGSELYSDLQEKYNAGAVTADTTMLLKHVRLVIASYALLDELAATHVKFTDMGVRTNASENLPKAVGWEYKELKRYLLDRAMDGTEVLLSYLWKKKADLPLWTASAAYKQFEGLILRTATEFNDACRLYQPMRTFYAVRSTLRDVQEFYCISGLGPEMVKYLATLSNPTEPEADILLQLKKALAYLTIRHAGEHFPVRFSDTGFTVLSMFGGDPEGENAGYSAASMELMKMKMNACERDGKNFMQRAKKLLATYRTSEEASAEFQAAYDAGPLKNYLDPSKRESGNEGRKFFRF